MTTRRAPRPLLLTGTVVVGLAIAVLATRSAGADEPTVLLPPMPPGATLTATMLNADATNADTADSLQDVRTSLTATLPTSGHAFVVIDCAGPASSTIAVQHRDQRPWSPAAIVDGANHADGSCQPTSKRQAYALNGAPSEVVTLDITGGPVAAYRVVISDARP
ncbi:hypothetical protein [Kineococcus radiotolerans]|uniref:Uncharacterized protein n=1 Tax=Kineococcus radiotolerans (strain ATCC BAA-149 / DSM 14245 / SRS30216) TaxID=266940 RepID=A6WAP9_KINRD|nr:hypothetical protein [Kineococcus radiotolerans]ABS03888.1 hypothetical protein Krad_2408 [Kineococcus radiotolerans SRS30216 = ATCC BAA-149]